MYENYYFKKIKTIIYIYIYIIMLCSIIYIILIRIKEERGVVIGHHFNWWKHQILTTHVVHVLWKIGAIQTNCLLHKWLMSKENGKKNFKLNFFFFGWESNLTLIQWLVSLKLEHRERKKLRIESQVGRANCRGMIL